MKDFVFLAVIVATTFVLCALLVDLLGVSDLRPDEAFRNLSYDVPAGQLHGEMWIRGSWYRFKYGSPENFIAALHGPRFAFPHDRDPGCPSEEDFDRTHEQWRRMRDAAREDGQ